MKSFINFLPPWVETNIQPAFYDKESGSVLQQTARMYAKVNQLIRHFNDLSKETKETVEEYIAKFVELKDFVDTYFDNLDVQEEINNKLDAMLTDGTLQEIIDEFLTNNVENRLEALDTRTFMGVFFDPTDSLKVKAFRSNDCLNFDILDIAFPWTQRDCSFATYNGKFYFIKTVSGYNNKFEILVTDDFTTYDSTIITLTGMEDAYNWHPEINIFDDGTGCIVFGHKDGSDTDIFGHTIDLWDQYIMTTSDIESLTFSSPTLLNLTTDSNRNHIDGQITKIGAKYYLIVKNEYAKKCEIWESTDLTTWTIVNTNITNSSLLVEGASLINAGDTIYYVADMYADGREIVSATSIEDFPNFPNKVIAPTMLMGWRHGRVNIITDNDCLNTLNDIALYRSIDQFKPVPYGYKYLAGSNVGYWNLPDLPVIDKFTYGIAGKRTAKITNPFNADKLLIKFAGSRGDYLQITHIDGVELSTPIKVINTNYTNGMIIEVPIGLASRAENLTDIVLYQNCTGTDVTVTDDTKFSIVSCYGHKMNNVATVNITIKLLTNDYSTQQWVGSIATLPTGFKPITTVITNSNKTQTMFITSNGVIQGNVEGVTDDTINITATYVIDTK